MKVVIATSFIRPEKIIGEVLVRGGQATPGELSRSSHTPK
jgi:hypothetical protein